MAERPHVRDQLRDAVIAALRGATAAGENVHEPGPVKWSLRNLPGIEVMNGDTSVSHFQQAPMWQVRDEQVDVIAIEDAGAEGIQRRLTALATDIETTIAVAGELNTVVVPGTLRLASENPAVQRRHDGELGMMRISYECRVVTTADDPTTPYPNSGLT